MFKNALVSCSDKTKLSDFLLPLQKKGLRIVSTGGTARYLREKGLKVEDVSAQTNFEEVMDGRVKTLHPNIHMALLARDESPDDLNTLKKFNLQPFDLVVGNLYPFEQEPTIDNIDIGGPSFLRAAAKNFARITVVCDPEDYEAILKKNEMTEDDRKLLAAKVFAHTSTYDSMITAALAPQNISSLREISFGGKFIRQLRYGENPQQRASWYRTPGVDFGLHTANIIQGKELSYNNIVDIDAAVSTLSEFSEPTCVGVKHNNPCGVAVHKDAAKALKNCMAADTQSLFGGIIAVNFAITEQHADDLNSVFLECIVAPEYTKDAVKKFSSKKNLRLVQWPQLTKNNASYVFKEISGGFLVQSRDNVEKKWDNNWEIIGSDPDSAQRDDLLFAWQVCAHLKSNAISIAENKQTIGLGMGQVNRVDAVQQAIERMQRFHKNCKTPVLASDAFFPFADSIEKIAAAGIKYVIQPGGSIKDTEVKEKAKNLGVTMVLTSKRHFLH